MKEMICIVCPVGCHLSIDEKGNVSGNNCPRGLVYAMKELTDPTRMVTSTIRTDSSDTPVISVKTSAPVPKKMIFEVMKEIDKIVVTKPLNIGDTVIKNVLNTGIDIIATKNFVK